MTQKLFALIIALSMIAQPITAQNHEQKSEQRRLSQAAAIAHGKGFVQGITTSLIASSLAMCAYLSSIKDDLYIPAKFNPHLVLTGKTQWVETIKKISETTSIKTSYSQPIYKTVWDKNPLHTAFQNTPEFCSVINGSPLYVGAPIEENMIQTIGSYMPSALAITGLCTLFGLFVYCVTQEDKAPENQQIRH